MLAEQLRREQQLLSEIATLWRMRALEAEARVKGALRVIHSAQVANKRPDLNSIRFYLEG